MPSDEEILCAVAGVKGLITLAEAKRRGLFCHKHQLLYSDWGSKQYICHDCVTEMRLSLGLKEWGELVTGLLPKLGENERIFLQDAAAGATPEYVLDLICGNAFALGLTPQQYVEQYQPGTLYSSPGQPES